MTFGRVLWKFMFWNLIKLWRIFFQVFVFIIKNKHLAKNFLMSVQLAPHYQHFLNFTRVLTLFTIDLEFLIGFKNSSSLLMHKKFDFRNAELTLSISTLLEKQIFFWVLGRFSIFLEFLIIFGNIPANYGKYSYSKFPPFFQNLIFKNCKSSVYSSGFLYTKFYKYVQIHFILKSKFKQLWHFKVLKIFVWKL